MNIEQAKFCAKFDAETTKLLFPEFNVDNFEIMKAWSDGARIDFQCFIPELSDGMSFSAHKSNYKILPETHIVNGIECPAPMRVNPEIGDKYYCNNSFGEVELWVWSGDNIDLKLFSIGNAFKSEEDAEDNAKAHYPSLRGEE